MKTQNFVTTASRMASRKPTSDGESASHERMNTDRYGEATAMRMLIGTLLIRAGFATIPKDVRHMVRSILMYHVPGALTEDEKSEIRAAKAAGWR